MDGRFGMLVFERGRGKLEGPLDADRAQEMGERDAGSGDLPFGVAGGGLSEGGAVGGSNRFRGRCLTSCNRPVAGRRLAGCRHAPAA